MAASAEACPGVSGGCAAGKAWRASALEGRGVRRRHRPQLAASASTHERTAGEAFAKRTLIFAATSGGVGGRVGFWAGAAARGSARARQRREAPGAFTLPSSLRPDPPRCDLAHGSGRRPAACRAILCTRGRGERHGPPVEGLRHLPDGRPEAGARDAHRGVPARLLRGQPRVRREHAPRSWSRSTARRSRRRSPSSARPRASRSSASGPRPARRLDRLGARGALGGLEGLGAAALEGLDGLGGPSGARPRRRRVCESHGDSPSFGARRTYVPSDFSSRARTLSFHIVSSASTTCFARAGSHDGERDLDAAEEVPLHPVGRREPDLRARRRSRRRTRGCARGSGPRWTARGSSRRRPGSPGVRQQIPRTRRSIGTPACDAS